jgi:hypothetical protein
MMDRKEQRTANSTFAIGVSCSAVRLGEGTESSVLRMNPDSYRDAKKPAHRKSAKRYASCLGDLRTSN